MNKTYQMTARNTFTAISFNTKLLRTKRIDTLDVVSVHNGEIGVAKSFEFNPLGKKPLGRKRKSFFEVFNYIRDKVVDCNVPVVGWGADDGKYLSLLIESHNIDIECPVRYFNLQSSARVKMADENVANDWRVVAERLNLKVAKTQHPSATDCARIHLALEATDYQLIVARAFLAFIKSIMDDDNRIDTFEAKGLQAFLSMLTSNFEQFRELRKIVDKTLEDDVIEAGESDLLMKELGNMREKYQAYIDSCDRKE